MLPMTRKFVTTRSGTSDWCSAYMRCHLTYACVYNSEQDLQRQVAMTKGQLRELRTSNESHQARLLDHTQRQGESHWCQTNLLPNIGSLS